MTDACFEAGSVREVATEKLSTRRLFRRPDPWVA